jgi:hypothetical protein
MIITYNLATYEQHTYTHKDARKAVQMSNAIEHNDPLNFEDYPVIEGKKTVASGDWAAHKEPKP